MHPDTETVAFISLPHAIESFFPNNGARPRVQFHFYGTENVFEVTHIELVITYSLCDPLTFSRIKLFKSVYVRVPQILPWRAKVLQSLVPTPIKPTWFSDDPEDIDLLVWVWLIWVRAKLCRKVDLMGKIWGQIQQNYRICRFELFTCSIFSTYFWWQTFNI